MGDGVGGSEWVSQKSACWGCVQCDHHCLSPSCDTTRGEPGRRCSLGTLYSSPVMSCRSLFRPWHEDYEHYIYGMHFKQEFGLWALQSQCLGPFLSIMWCWVSYWTSSARVSPYVNLRQFTLLYYCSIAQSCPTLCHPMDCSKPGFPVLHYLPELAQTHVCWVDDATQPSHPLLPPYPPALNLSQHQGLFQWVGSLNQVPKLKLQLQHQSFQWIFSTDFLYNWLLWSPCCPRDSQESSPTPQFKSINSSALSLLYGTTLPSLHDYWKNHTFNYMEDFPGGSDGKVSVYNVGDLGSSPGSGRSPGEGNGNPLQYYCLENPMDRGAW